MIAVRPVRREEVPRLVLAGKLIHQLSAYAHMAFDVPTLIKRGEHSLQYPDQFFAEAITKDDLAIGVLWAMISPSFFGPDLVAQDLIFFVMPQFHNRVGEALREIVDNYQTWARMRGAKMVNLGCSTQIDPERTAALFEHLGYPRTGSLHAVRLH